MPRGRQLDSLAVMEPDPITVGYGFYFEVRDADSRLAQTFACGRRCLAALRETSRFFRL